MKNKVALLQLLFSKGVRHIKIKFGGGIVLIYESVQNILNIERGVRVPVLFVHPLYTAFTNCGTMM